MPLREKAFKGNGFGLSMKRPIGGCGKPGSFEDKPFFAWVRAFRAIQSGAIAAGAQRSMATEAAGAGPRLSLPNPRQRLPERIPDLKRPWLSLFELFWYPAL